MKGKRHMKVSAFSGISEFAIDHKRGYLTIIAYDKLGASWKSKRESFELIYFDHEGCNIMASRYTSSRLNVDRGNVNDWRSPLQIDGVDMT